jgi:flavin-dependent dehydrogenase
MAHRDYDAIVVGASFGGLAVARELAGEVLLLDRHEVGTMQTSACGTPLWVPQSLGLEASVLQVHERLELRTPSRKIVYDLRDVPFCTFDFRAFTEGLLAQSRATFVRAAATRLDGAGVQTTEGRFTAPIIVDASGWRGVLVRGAGSAPPARICSFGLESRTPLLDDRLIFVAGARELGNTFGWIFPVGDGSLVGLGSYAGLSNLGPPLRRFARGLGVEPNGFHGTFFTNRLLPATVGRIFAVGDAAGQCLPLTAEGIRPAIFFGLACGQILRRVVEGRLSLEAALTGYAAFVERYRWAYRLLRAPQWIAASLPSRCFALLAASFGRGRLRKWWWPRYGLFGHPERARKIEMVGQIEW